MDWDFARFSYLCVMNAFYYLLFLIHRTLCFSSFQLHPSRQNSSRILLMHTVKSPWKKWIDLLRKALRASHRLAFPDTLVCGHKPFLSNPDSCHAGPSVLGDSTHLVHIPPLAEKDLSVNPTLKINRTLNFLFSLEKSSGSLLQ